MKKALFLLYQFMALSLLPVLLFVAILHGLMKPTYLSPYLQRFSFLLPKKRLKKGKKVWIPQGDPVFDASLRTGEDVKFVRQLRAAGCRVRFCGKPVVRHHDREEFGAFFRHQYRWGLHTYAMRFGGGGALLHRCAIAGGFVLLLPCFALASTVINIVPWLRRSPVYILYFIPLVLLYLCKGVAVVHGTLRPGAALYSSPDSQAE